MYNRYETNAFPGDKRCVLLEKWGTLTSGGVIKSDCNKVAYVRITFERNAEV